MTLRYATLVELKAYGTVIGNTDDDLLTKALYRSEAQIDAYTGTSWDQGTQTLVRPVNPFVDSSGWVWLKAMEKRPVTAVAAVQYRAKGTNTWTSLTWDADNILLPHATEPPDPDSDTVRIFSLSPSLASIPTGTGLFRWTYTGGYATIPESLKAIHLRLSWWYYKLREAPMGIVRNQELSLTDIPLSIPPDVKADLNLWKGKPS